jgi:hypothetical protein
MILGLCLVCDRNVDDRRIAQSFIKALPHSPSLIRGLKYFGSGRFDETGYSARRKSGTVRRSLVSDRL